MASFLPSLLKNISTGIAGLATSKSSSSSRSTSAPRYTGYSTTGGNPARNTTSRNNAVLRSTPKRKSLPTKASNLTKKALPNSSPSRQTGSSVGASGSVSSMGSALSTPSFKPIPTFGASYYLPKDTQKLMDSILGKKPTYDKDQLNKRAKAETDLLTNPQIEALREQLNAFKTLIPETSQGLQDMYTAAQGQLQGSQSELYRTLLDEAEVQGGTRVGVAQALQQQLSKESSPLREALKVDYQNTREQVLGMLENQKQEASGLLSSIQKNKKNMTRDNFNALKDQAIAQFKDAQNVQKKFLESIRDIETQARDSAATFQQEGASAYNDYQSKLTQMQNQQILDMYQQSMDSQPTQQDINDSLDYWISGVQQANSKQDAMKFLVDNSGEIMASIGVDGYDNLVKQVNTMPWNTVGGGISSSGVGSTSPLTTTARNVGIRTGLSSMPSTNPGLAVLKGLSSFLK